MGYRWIGATHWTPGRQGKPVTGVVVHWMATTLAGADATFTNTGPDAREASAHYGVEGSTVHGYVRETDTAWALGVWEENLRTISVEVSAQPGRDATGETIATVIDLVTRLCRDHGLTADDIHQHSDYKNTQCPGTVPVARIREAVRANLVKITLQSTTSKGSFMAALTDAEQRELLEKTRELHRDYSQGILYVRKDGDSFAVLRAIAAKLGLPAINEAARAAKYGAKK